MSHYLFQFRDSDKRKFRAQLLARYPSLGTEQLDELVPKQEPIVCAKLAPRDELISKGREPLFFTHGRREELIPTVEHKRTYLSSGARADTDFQGESAEAFNIIPRVSFLFFFRLD